MFKVLKVAFLMLVAVSVFSFVISFLEGDYKAPVEQKIIVLDKSNLLVLNQQVDTNSVHELMVKAHELDSDVQAILEKRPIYLYLKTPGGDVEAGLSLRIYLSNLQRPVHTITEFAASMGFQLVQGLGTRYILPTGVLMSHHSRGGVQGEIGGLPGSQIEKRLEFWKKRLEEMDLLTVLRTKGKQSLRSYREAYENELWLTGSQSLKGGYADEIIGVRCGDTGPALEGMIQFMGLVIKVKVPSCPLDPGMEADTSALSEEQKAKFPTDLTYWYQTHIIPLEIK